MLFLLYFLNFFNYYYLKPPGSVAGEVVVNKRALFWAKKMGVWCFYSLPSFFLHPQWGHLGMGGGSAHLGTP